MTSAIKFHAIGDVHISDRHLPLTQEALAGTLKLVEKKQDVDILVVMGDVFDRHDNIKLSHQRMAIDFIKKLAEKKPTIVLVGNHDRVNNQDFMSDIHPYMGIEDIPGKLYIANKPKVLRVNRKIPIMNSKGIQTGEEDKSFYLLFMPYVAPGKFVMAINLYIKSMHEKGKLKDVNSPEDFALIFGHQEFEGAPYGPIVSVKGDKWPSHYPQVISGHIHTRMMLTDNIYYTGSLYPINTSESNDKGVITGSYDPVTKKWIEPPKVTRVVMSQKEVKRLNAVDAVEISEMVAMDRKHTKYIVQGTPEEIAAVKGRVQGMDLNIAYDVRPKRIINTKYDFDEMLRNSINDDSMRKLLEEIIA